MPLYNIKLIDKREVANNTIMFIFEKPKGFTFIPGQYGGFTLIQPKEVDQGGITRRFSLLSSPDDNHLAIVTRIQTQSHAYKRVLNQLPIGCEIKFAGPTGNFILHDELKTPAILIAGGIGIAPFYSMIKHTISHKIPRKIILFYGNATRLDAAFLDELNQCQITYPFFKLIAAMDKPESSWQGETGFITHIMIKKHVHDIRAPFYYICGAPSMVTTIQEMLVEMNIDEDHIQVEDFPGY